MSRSNQENGQPNPATRWFEWNGDGEKGGTVRYYDKDEKRNVDVGNDFYFVLLDELASVRGWHDPSQSGIYSNEVKDTRQDVLVVKSFKGGTIAEGLYRDIKDRVNVAGGSFTANCYIAYKAGGTLQIGSLRFKGSALGAWMEFRKANKADLYKKAIRIVGFDEGKKGRIAYRTPKFRLVDLTDATNDAAIVLDKQLQEFLHAYLKKTKADAVEATASHVRNTEEPPPPSDDDRPPVYEDDIPF